MYRSCRSEKYDFTEICPRRVLASQTEKGEQCKAYPLVTTSFSTPYIFACQVPQPSYRTLVELAWKGFQVNLDFGTWPHEHDVRIYEAREGEAGVLNRVEDASIDSNPKEE